MQRVYKRKTSSSYAGESVSYVYYTAYSPGVKEAVSDFAMGDNLAHIAEAYEVGAGTIRPMRCTPGARLHSWVRPSPVTPACRLPIILMSSSIKGVPFIRGQRRGNWPRAPAISLR